MITSGLRHMRRTLVSKGEKRGCRVSKGVGACGRGRRVVAGGGAGDGFVTSGAIWLGDRVGAELHDRAGGLGD
jgi:hypothetical protein